MGYDGYTNRLHILAEKELDKSQTGAYLLFDKCVGVCVNGCQRCKLSVLPDHPLD